MDELMLEPYFENKFTGECVRYSAAPSWMLHCISADEMEWATDCDIDFRKRYAAILLGDRCGS